MGSLPPEGPRPRIRVATASCGCLPLTIMIVVGLWLGYQLGLGLAGGQTWDSWWRFVAGLLVGIGVVGLFRQIAILRRRPPP